MKIDWISTLSEIAPYFGHLDDTYRLMRKLNTTTSEMWNKTCYKLSELVERKSINCSFSNQKEIIKFPLRFPLAIILYRWNPADINTEEKLKLLKQLFQEFEAPKMINTVFGLNLFKERDTCIKISNYKEHMKDLELWYLDIYNTIIETAIKREIDLRNIYSYIFIHEITLLKDVQYIRSIIFPWSENADVDWMIETWDQFVELKSFKYEEVKLVWDGINIDHFMKIFQKLWDQKIKWDIIIKKDFKFLELLLKKCGNLPGISGELKFWEEGEYILYDGV